MNNTQLEVLGGLITILGIGLGAGIIICLTRRRHLKQEWQFRGNIDPNLQLQQYQ